MSQREYVTVQKGDSQYQQLIHGFSSDGRVALPIDSLSMRKDSQWMTFELIPKEATQRPSRLYVILLGIRPLYLSMTLTSPIFCITEMIRSGVLPVSFLPISILLSLTFLHFSMFLFNDYKDHFKGVDLNQSGKKMGIIKRGWATANEVRMWAYVNFALGAVFAVPALVGHPLFVAGMGGIVLIIFFAVTGLKTRLGRWGLNEFLVSLSLGPLLAFGFSQTVYGQFSWFSLSLCIVLGWIASLVFQCKYLEEMVFTFQNRRESLIGSLGFDRSKRFIMLQLIGLPFLSLAMTVAFQEYVVGSVLSVSLLVLAAWFYRNLSNAPSPMSSGLFGLSQKMAISHIVVGSVVSLTMLGLAWL